MSWLNRHSELVTPQNGHSRDTALSSTSGASVEPSLPPISPPSDNKKSDTGPGPAEKSPPAPEGAHLLPDQLNAIKQKIHEQLLRELDLDKIQQKRGPELRKAVEGALAVMLLDQDTPISRGERQRLVREIADEALGLGPLEPLLDDVTVSEIMVNGPRQVYVERKGLLSLSDVSFRDETHIMRIIEKIVSPLGRRVDEASPMVDARLPDGSRVNAIIPPLAIDSPILTIRKFSRDPLTADDLIRFGSLNEEVVTFLKACIETRINMVVAGGTGSGKTTMLNVLSSFIPSRERIVTIEDPVEMQLRQPHVVRLETRPANIEGKGEVGQRQLVRNALRMRPDRIIVGEVRSGEAFDMLQAMNTGHDGSLTTIHANTPRDALARIENMVLMANLDLPVRAIREQVASAIHLILQLSRLRDGSRRVTHVTEVIGMEGDVITMQDIFLFRQLGTDPNGKIIGSVQPTGLRPYCVDKIEREGITLPADLFAVRTNDRLGRR
ncbi:MAG TPA: CpaF family protein [Chloroflexota bacterium]|nr:CpaF family protein [Chloroflexota bacterium]